MIEEEERNAEIEWMREKVQRVIAAAEKYVQALAVHHVTIGFDDKRQKAGEAFDVRREFEAVCAEKFQYIGKAETDEKEFDFTPKGD